MILCVYIAMFSMSYCAADMCLRMVFCNNINVLTSMKPSIARISYAMCILDFYFEVKCSVLNLVNMKQHFAYIIWRIYVWNKIFNENKFRAGFWFYVNWIVKSGRYQNGLEGRGLKFKGIGDIIQQGELMWRWSILKFIFLNELCTIRPEICVNKVNRVSFEYMFALMQDASGFLSIFFFFI